MNKMINGTEWRETQGGIVAVRGKRELHLLGTSVDALCRARDILASHSFDSLFRRARKAPHSRNIAFARV